MVRTIGPVEECLVKAHELVLQGWIKNRSHWIYPHERDAYCISGAIEVAGDNGGAWSAWQLINDAVSADFLTGYGFGTVWNDKIASTLQEVSDLFMDAIDIARLENL